MARKRPQPKTKPPASPPPPVKPLPGTPQPEPEQVDVFACSLELKGALLEFLENEPLQFKRVAPLIDGLAKMQLVKLNVVRQ